MAEWESDLVGHFPGSRIILNNGKPAAQVWSLCYSSLTDNHDNPAAFHTQCDPYSITVMFARNSLGYTFGGYVRCVFVSTFCPIFLARFVPVDAIVH